jgi:hypothetical protein
MERKPGVAGGSKWTYEATFHIAMKGGREYYTTAATGLTHSMMLRGITTISIMTFSIITLRKMTFSITTLSIIFEISYNEAL